MAKHMVVCERCGRQFDANFGASYNRLSRRYICPRCTGTSKKRPSVGAMIAKIVFGLLFIAVGISPSNQEPSLSFFLIGFIIGGGLIAWGIVPFLKAKKQKKEEEKLLAEAKRQLANEPKKCPSCGAVTKGSVCEYCGSKL